MEAQKNQIFYLLSHSWKVVNMDILSDSNAWALTYWQAYRRYIVVLTGTTYLIFYMSLSLKCSFWAHKFYHLHDLELLIELVWICFLIGKMEILPIHEIIVKLRMFVSLISRKCCHFVKTFSLSQSRPSIFFCHHFISWL